MKTDTAWLAGIIDGEGSIYPGGTSRKYVSTTLRLCMTSRTVVQMAHRIFGVGTIYTRLRKSPWKRQFDLVISGQDTTTAINLIRPYLKLKHRQADLALRINELPRGHHNKMKLALRLRSLNRRGR
jgi:hypothetical protein